MFPAALLGSPTARALDAAKLHEVVRSFGGESPASWRDRRGVALEMLDATGITQEIPPKGPRGGEVGAFFALCDTLEIPADHAASLGMALSRKFPAAGGEALVEACRRLLPELARFQDWAGAVALLRAVPAQRTIGPVACADALVGWLAKERDLFDAQRSLVHLESGGQRSLVEVLRLLSQSPSGSLS